MLMNWVKKKKFDTKYKIWYKIQNDEKEIEWLRNEI